MFGHETFRVLVDLLLRVDLLLDNERAMIIIVLAVESYLDFVDVDVDGHPVVFFIIKQTRCASPTSVLRICIGLKFFLIIYSLQQGIFLTEFLSHSLCGRPS